MIESSSTSTRRVVTEAEAASNNLARITRMLGAVSRRARSIELTAHKMAVARVFPYIKVDEQRNLFCSMYPSTLSAANVDNIDLDGYVLPKAEGIACNAGWYWYSIRPPRPLPPVYAGPDTGATQWREYAERTRDEAQQRIKSAERELEEAMANARLLDKTPRNDGTLSMFERVIAPQRTALQEAKDSVPPPWTDETMPARPDSVVIWLRGAQSPVVIDGVPLLPACLHTAYGRSLFDAELVVRRRTLTTDETLRFREATRETSPFCAPYMEPDSGRPEDDDKYELCIVLHDMMLADSAQQTSAAYAPNAPKNRRPAAAVAVGPYHERQTKMRERAEPRPVTEQAMSLALNEVLRERRQSVVLFVKQSFPMTKLEHAFYCIDRRMQGVRCDGIVFVGNKQPFSPQTDPERTTLLKCKPRFANTIDCFLVQRDSGAVEMYAADSEAPLPHAGIYYGATPIEIDQTTALLAKAFAANQRIVDATLFSEADQLQKQRGVIVECMPHIDADAQRRIDQLSPEQPDYVQTAACYIRWHPLLHRERKHAANTLANINGILTAIVRHVTPAQIVERVKQRLRERAEAEAHTIINNTHAE